VITLVSVSDERPSLRDRKKDATRQLIEDVAWDLFGSQGFDATTVQQIAEQANVAPRTFFRYFPTKEAVLYPELDGLLHELAAAFAARPADEPAMVAMLNAFDVVNQEIASDADRQLERHELLKRSAAGTTSTFFYDRIAAAVASMIRERHRDEPDAEAMARLAAGLVGTVMAVATERWLAHGGTTSIDDEARRCTEILRSLMI
jgi:AcrR family transcriptional regulator